MNLSHWRRAVRFLPGHVRHVMRNICLVLCSDEDWCLPSRCIPPEEMLVAMVARKMGMSRFLVEHRSRFRLPRLRCLCLDSRLRFTTVKPIHVTWDVNPSMCRNTFRLLSDRAAYQYFDLLQRTTIAAMTIAVAMQNTNLFLCLAEAQFLPSHPVRQYLSLPQHRKTPATSSIMLNTMTHGLPLHVHNKLAPSAVEGRCRVSMPH